MILGDLTDSRPADAIGPAVAHIDYGCPIPAHQHRNQGSAHAVKFLELSRLVVNREIGQLHRAAEHLIDPVRLHPRQPAPADFLHKDLHRQGAGNVAGFGAAHAVTDHAQQGLLVQPFNSVSILILLAHASGIRKSPALHRPSTSLLYSCFFSYFLRSCPQEASISPPKVLRTVAVTPPSSRIF